MVHSLEELIKNKSRWGVSVAALTRTAFDSGVLSDWHYRELCKQISSRGYRTKEPFPMKREGSVLWKKVFEELWKDRLTRDHVAAELGIPSDEITSLIGGLSVKAIMARTLGPLQKPGCGLFRVSRMIRC